MDEEDGRLGPPPGHIIGDGAYSAKYGTRQQDGFQDPDRLKLLIDVTDVRARQPGRSDVLADASTKSLCNSSLILMSGARMVLSSPMSGARAKSKHSHPYPFRGELQ
jgi:hypothetical protein